MIGLSQYFSTFLVPRTPDNISLIMQTPSPKLSQCAHPLDTIHGNI